MRVPIHPRTANETTSTAAKLIHSFFMNLPFKTMTVENVRISGGDGPGSNFSHRSQANPSGEPIPFSVVRVATATQLPYRKLHGIYGLRIASGANCASRKRGSNQWGKSRTE